MSKHDEDVMAAGVAMIGRTGATNFVLRYDDEDKADNEPTVWFALVHYKREAGDYWDTAAGMNPTTAVLRLCELLVDGGQCQHCKRPTAFDSDWETPPLMTTQICWYLYDPERKTFRRSCEGDT